MGTRPPLVDRLVAFDVETTGDEPLFGLQPWRVREGKARLTSYAVAERPRPFFTWAESPVDEQALDKLRSFLVTCAREDKIIVGWNTPFDVAWLLAYGMREEVFACQWLDAMLLYKHLHNIPTYDNPPSAGLKAAVQRYLPQHAGYEKDVAFDPPEDPEELALWRKTLVKYNKLDAIFTLRLARKFLEELGEGRRAALIEARCIPMIAEATLEGVSVDTDKAVALSASLENTYLTAVATLRLTDGVTEEQLNSTKQLQDLLFSKWALTPVKITDKGAFSTDRTTLSVLAAQDHRAGLVNTYREAKNNRVKFAEGVINSADYNGDGHVRPAPRPFGTYTGRMTYSSKQGKGVNERPTGVALHQWKRSPEYRDIITAPEGYELLEFDFAGQEFRWMAVLSGDRTMIELCEPGQDAHAYMGAAIGHLDYDSMRKALKDGDPEAKRLRQLGKVANLALQYRTSASTLATVAAVQHGIALTLPEARSIHATYLATYRDVSRYWHKQENLARDHGFVRNIAGRAVQVKRGNEWTHEDTWGRVSTAINYPIQSAGADQKYLALAMARDYLPSVGGRFYFELHDGLFFVVPENHADRAVHELGHLLGHLPYEKAWGVKLPVMFPVDAKRGKTWGTLKVVEI